MAEEEPFCKRHRGEDSLRVGCVPSASGAGKRHTRTRPKGGFHAHENAAPALRTPSTEQVSLPERYDLGPSRSQGLVDVLDRILDKGLVIAGDIRVNLADVELLTIQIRLLVCSVDKAAEIGMDWWRTDPRLSTSAQGSAGYLEELGRKLDQIDQRLAALEKTQLKP